MHSEAFIRSPEGYAVGDRCATKVSNIDFAPTLLDIAQIESDDYSFDGKSFLPVLEGQQQEHHDALFFELGFVRGVIQGDYKYIALRYPAHIENMPLAQRKRVLEKFNAAQKRRGRPVYTEDPMAPFSHVSAIPGGGDAEHKAIKHYPDFYDSDQLYDLSVDPNEQNNLIDSEEHQEKLEELKRVLETHLRQMPGSFGEFTASPSASLN